MAQRVGYWQFEMEGINAVVIQQNSHVLAALSTMDISVGQIQDAVHYNDPIACVIARLLLWSDAAPLPMVGDNTGAGITTRATGGRAK